MNPEPTQWGATRSQPLGVPAAPVDQPPTYPPPAGEGLPAAPPRRRRTGLIVGLILAALVLVGGGTALALVLTHGGPGAAPAKTQTFNANGTLTVHGGCEGLGGYGDITTGTQVVLTDAAGKTVAVGQLQSTHSTTLCSYTWSLSDIPAGEKFYGLSVAKRGVLQVTQVQLEAGVNINIG